MTPDQILQEIRENFTSGKRRKFAPALLLAFISFLRELGATGGRFASLDEFYEEFPRVTETGTGGGVNTLKVKWDSKTLSIRPHYNRASDWFRSEQKRYDFPSSAPHATQAWPDYTHWLAALLAFDERTLDQLDAEARAFVLDVLPSQDIDPESVSREPARFLRFLEEFDMSAKQGETSGACYQGTVFGFIRADAPHLQVEVGKVRTGSKREKRVGDIDARDGELLVLSAEVKQFIVGVEHLPDLAEFGNLIARHQALGLVVALSFGEDAAAAISGIGLHPVSRQDLIERARLWDPLKQKIAINALLYYSGFREQSSALTARIKTFVDSLGESQSTPGEDVSAAVADPNAAQSQ